MRDFKHFQDHSDDAVGGGDGVAVQDQDHLELQLCSQELECVSNIATDSCAHANGNSFAYWAAQLVGEKSASQGGSSPPPKKKRKVTFVDSFKNTMAKVAGRYSYFPQTKKILHTYSKWIFMLGFDFLLSSLTPHPPNWLILASHAEQTFAGVYRV